MEGTDIRVMEKVWRQVAECDERIKLMKKLIKLGIGLAEVEEFGLNIQKKLKSFQYKNKIREGEVITKEMVKTVMELKLKDEKKYLRELLKTQKRMQLEIERKAKKNSRPARRALREFREKANIAREEHRKKYKEKIKHLNNKYRESTDEMIRIIPTDMEELRDLRVFNPERYNEMKEEEYEVKIIGDVKLNENEMKILKLHPKFAILPRLVEGGLDLDEELANSKLRMQIHKEYDERKEKNELGLDLPVEDDKAKIEEIELEAKSRQVFNPMEKTYDERKRRVTDLRECNRVTLPKPLPEIEEAKIEIRRGLHTEIFNNYRKEHCTKDGRQRSNLTKEEEEGLRSLEKRIKTRELIIIRTDKSSRFAVCSEEAYLRMGSVHTNKDKKIKRKELLDTEKVLNAHCVAWGKMWKSGDNHEHRSRIVNSKKTNSENCADMYILFKDHKEGEKTRPIVTGCTSNTLGLSNCTASVLEAVAASEETPFESISSEDMLAKTKKFNKERLEKIRTNS